MTNSLKDPTTWLAILASASSGIAQCSAAWEVPTGFAAQGTVHAMARWDPDGAGPALESLVIAGSFASAGGVVTENIVRYDPVAATFAALGTGVTGVVRALVVLPNGNLVVGGTLSAAGGSPVDNVASWNGTMWQPVGGGVSGGGVESLVVGATGDLFAGGTFTQAGGAPASRVARWDGLAWSSLGPGLTGQSPFPTPPIGVRGLALLPNGDLVAVGGFTQAGATPADQIARWDGTSWWAGGLSVPILSSVQSIAPATGGVLVGLTNPTAVWRFDGTTWTALSTPPAPPLVLRELANGDTIAGAANFLFGSGGGVSRLRSGVWTSLGDVGSGVAGVGAISVMPGSAPDQFVIGGTFASIAGVSAGSLARWNGVAWAGEGPPFPGIVSAVAVGADGRIVVGGQFQSVSGQPASRVAAWDGTSWQPLGNGLLFAPTDLTVRDNGDILAFAGATAMRWDGVSWTAVSSIPPARWFVTGAAGQLAVFDDIRLHVLNGTTWQSIGASQVQAAAFAPDGTLVAGGRSTSFPTVGRVARWNGTTWQSLDPTTSITGTVQAIAVLPTGAVFAGGSFNAPAVGIAELVGGNWQQVGAGLNGVVNHLRVLPDGKLLAIGDQITASGSTPLSGAAIWNGTVWSPLPGFTYSYLGSPYIADVAVHPAGDLVLGGAFLSPTAFYARRRSSCPANAAVVGSGCNGSGGANRLAAVTWPLVGAKLTVRGSELPVSGLAVAVSSFNASNLPLASLLSQGQPGCTLWVAPDVTALVPVQGGTGLLTWDVPLIPSAIGTTFRHQWVPFEIGAGGALAAVTATPALGLTFGMLP